MVVTGRAHCSILLYMCIYIYIYIYIYICMSELDSNKAKDTSSCGVVQSFSGVVQSLSGLS